MLLISISKFQHALPTGCLLSLWATPSTSLYLQGSENLPLPLVVDINTSGFTVIDQQTSHHLHLRLFLYVLQLPMCPLFTSLHAMSLNSLSYSVIESLPRQSMLHLTIQTPLKCCMLKAFWSAIQISLRSPLPALPSCHEPAYHHPFLILPARTQYWRYWYFLFASHTKGIILISYWSVTFGWSLRIPTPRTCSNNIEASTAASSCTVCL